MEIKRLVPDEVTFTSLIDGFVLLGRLDHAFVLLRRMVDMGCKPNYRTYNVLLKGLHKECQLLTERVMAQNETLYGCSSDEKVSTFELIGNLLLRLSENGCEPTIEVYNTLVSGLCREGKSYEASQLVEDMKEKGLSPSMDILCSLLVAQCKNLEVDSALGIFNLLAVKGIKPYLSIYKVLICALCRSSRVEEAQSLFHSLLEEKWNSDLIVWTVLVDGLLHEGQSDVCMKFLHLMESRNCALSLYTYLSLARELSKVRKSSETNKISKENRQLSVPS